MIKTDPIQITGRGTRVDVTIDDTAPFELVTHNLRRHLYEYRGLYSHGTVTVNVGRRIWLTDQMARIKEIVDRESGLTVSDYYCPAEVMEQAGRNGPMVLASVETTAPDDSAADRETPAKLIDSLAVASRQPAQPKPVEETAPAAGGEAEPTRAQKPAAGDAGPSAGAVKPAEPTPEDAGSSPDAADSSSWQDEFPALPAPAAPEEIVASDRGLESGSAGPRGELALILKTTCRSGEVINHPGDVVALADVNPGAEIVAGGSIVVLGALRGLAHAGAGGDLQATIIAFALESPRLQIGPHVSQGTTKGRPNRSFRNGPKVAYLHNQSIYVAPFARRLDQYQGGVPYGG